jgi:hypothetical protein
MSTKKSKLLLLMISMSLTVAVGLAQDPASHPAAAISAGSDPAVNNDPAAANVPVVTSDPTVTTDRIETTDPVDTVDPATTTAPAPTTKAPAAPAGTRAKPGAPAAAVAPPPPAPDSGLTMSQVVDRIIQREAMVARKMKDFHPLVETYLQQLQPDQELAFTPAGDQYFLGKLYLGTQVTDRSLLDQGSKAWAVPRAIRNLYSVKYLPAGFAQMLLVDGAFERKNYDFEYVRREFLGDVRCLVFDVTPKPKSVGTFSGRIWVEDQDYNVVRFNGTYGPSTPTKMYFHFDSWRENIGPGLWLPAYVYSEESDMRYLKGLRKLRFKGQTRIWGYNVGKSSQQNELTSLIVESDQVRDTVDTANGLSPVRALRAWERQAEDNVIQRLEKAGLLAPDGEVNKILETVATNLEVTNNLSIEPEVRARVLLTSPLESFTIGHTIVLSRGLIDVLPDEASLAMIIAHELAHIALGHRLDTKYSFNDRMLFDDEKTLQRVDVKRDEREENEADKKAAEFLQNSPYKDKLANAGLFLKAVAQRAPELSHLLKSHMGNSMTDDSKVLRMTSLMQSAPQLEMNRVDQIAALPLGGRVKVDGWTGRIELVKAPPVPLLSAREKMPFEVTPVYLYLTRQTTTAPNGATAAAAPPTPAKQ